MASNDPEVSLLRHTVATLAYRGGKTLRGAPADFANYKAAPGTRTPGEILAHLCDLLDWAVTIADGQPKWQNTELESWPQGVARFFAALDTLDQRLSAAPLKSPPEKLFQGPVADALTHVGQIAMLRRMSGAPIRGESYYRAEIVSGRVGAEQTPSAFEFD